MRLQHQAAEGNSNGVSSDTPADLRAEDEVAELSVGPAAGAVAATSGTVPRSLRQVPETRLLSELGTSSNLLGVIGESDVVLPVLTVGPEGSSVLRNFANVTRRRFATDAAARPPDCAEPVTSGTDCADAIELSSSCRSSFDRDPSLYSSDGVSAVVEDEEFAQVKVIDTDDEREIARKRLQVKELQRPGKRSWSTTADEVSIERCDESVAVTPPRAESNTMLDAHVEGPALKTPHKRRSFGTDDNIASDNLHTINRKQLRPRGTGRAARRLTIEVLSADIMQQVFRHLSLLPDLSLRAANVCRAWRNVALDPRLWQELDFEHFERVNNSIVLTYTQRAQGQLRLLDLSKCHQVSNTAIVRIAWENPQLRTIRLAWCTSVTDFVVTEIARSCRDLQEIVLACCVNVTGVAVDALAEHCPSLTVLNLACIGKIEPQSLTRLFRRCPNLEQLHIVNSSMVDDRVVAQMARRLPRLKFLDISWCCHVTDDSLCRLARYCRELEHLELGDTKVSSHGVRTLLRCCKRLTGIGLPRCIFVDDELIHAILAFAGDRLESLNIASCNRITDEAVRVLLEQSTALRKLDVSKLPCRQLGNLLRKTNPHLEIFY